MFVENKQDATSVAQSGALYAPLNPISQRVPPRQRNRAKPPRNLVLGLKKWIGHVRCEKKDATSEVQSGVFYAPQNPISQRVPPGNGIARNNLET